MRPFATTILEVAGGIAVAVGAFTVNLTVGLVVSGVLAISAGYLLER